MKKDFDIIIPVTVKFKMAKELLDNLRWNSEYINQVIIIDNSTDGKFFNPKDDFSFPVNVFTSGFRRSCNASWNYGITKLSEDCKYVTILNDDLSVGPWFLSRIFNILENHPEAGAACPETIQDPSWEQRDQFLNDVPELSNIQKMKKREGGAFTLRKTILDATPPIPDELEAFYGDDWFWRWTYKMGFIWMKDYNNKVYHLGGVTNTALGINYYDYKAEKRLWLDIVEKFGLQRYRNKK